MLRFFSESGAEVCFKFDPDTMVDGIPRAIPKAQYFGDVWRSRLGFRFIQGGITGLGGAAIHELLRSRLLEPSLCESWMKGIPISPVLMDDQLLAMALQKLGVLPSCWSECRSRWKTPVQNDHKEYAIVHPRYY
jgi:hypothetical protein